MNKAIIAFACLLSASCAAHVDVGQADYRIAEPPQARTSCSGSSICDPLSPANLERRYLPGALPDEAPFQRNEVFTIVLEQAVMGPRISEAIVLGNEIGPSLGDYAEIAILANVFEFSPAASTEDVRGFLNGTTDMIAGKNAPDAIKLVYYSDDVRPNQPLNFDSIALYPRSAYSGASIGVQLVVLEVDSQSPAVGSLLSTLAEFGKGAMPTLPGATDVIFDLGESLFTGGSGDDKVLDYRFVLAYGGDGSDFPKAEFAPGRYVLMRQQDRRSPINWNEFQVDHNSGRLFRKLPLPAGATAEVRDRFYMTINMQRYPAGTSAEALNLQAWSAFRKTLDEAGTGSGDAAVIALESNLRSILLEQNSTRRTSDLVASWNEAERSLRMYEQLYLSNEAITPSGRCGIPNAVIAGNRDQAERKALNDVREFVSLYQKGLAAVAATAPVQPTAQATVPGTASTDPDASGFQLAHRESLVSHLSSFFVPWKEDHKQVFASAAAFETAFINAGATRVLGDEAALLAAGRAVAATQCGDLAARGIVPRGSVEPSADPGT